MFVNKYSEYTYNYIHILYVDIIHNSFETTRSQVAIIMTNVIYKGKKNVIKSYLLCKFRLGGMKTFRSLMDTVFAKNKSIQVEVI